jgi:Gpi18-like mannosyltransferase
LRLALLRLHGHQHDVRIFVGWAKVLAQYGTHGLYAHPDPASGTFVNYPPAYALSLLAVVRAYQYVAPHADPGDAILIALLKLPAIVADLGIAALAFLIVRRWTSPRNALVATAIAAFGPSTWPVSAIWGQVDSLCALFLVGAFYAAIARRYELAWISLAIGILIKPFPLAVAPLLAVAQYRDAGFSPRLVLGPACAVAVAYVTTLPFAPGAAPFAALAWLARQYASGQSLFPLTSVNAWNLWTAFAEPVPDSLRVAGLSLQAWGWIFFGALDLAVTIVLARRLASERGRAAEHVATLAWFVALLGVFDLASRMHERYLIFALALAPLVWFCGRPERVAALLLMLTFTLNSGLVLYWKFAALPENDVLIHAISLANLAALLVVALRFARRSSPETSLVLEPA